MKVAVFSDLHVFPHPEHAKVIRPGVTDRLLDCVSVLTDIRQYCVDHEIRLVLFGGDLWHRRAVLGVPFLNLVVAELVRWKAAGITLCAGAGNHDQVTKAADEDAIFALAKAELLLAPTSSIGHKTWCFEDALVVSGFVYSDNRTLFSERLELAERDARQYHGVPRIGLFHHGFQGARVGTHLEYQVREPISAKKRLNGHRFDRIFSGHYHSHQKIQGLENAHYIGSPLEFTRATKDDVSDKGFLVYDSATNSFEAVPLARPKFVAIGQAELDAGDFSICPGNFVDVGWDHYPGGAVKLGQDLQAVGARAWKLMQKRKIVSSGRQEVNPSTPPAQALAAYLETKSEEMKALGLSPKRILKLGLEKLQEASEE